MKPSTLFFALHLALVSSAALAAEPAPGLAATPGVKLVDQVAARRIEARKPVEPAVRFPADVGEVVAFVNLANPGTPTVVQQRWTFGGKVRYTAKLPVGKAAGWRTWSRHRMGRKDTGTWTVETLTSEGAVLGTLTFDVEGTTGTSVSAVDRAGAP